MGTHQALTNDQYDLQTINQQLSQSMKKGTLPDNINFTELDGLWHVCGTGTFSDWEIVATSNPSIFDLKLPFREGVIVILGESPKTLTLHKCSLFIQIDLQPLEKESIADAGTQFNEFDLINSIRVEDPTGELNQQLHYLTMSICSFLKLNDHAITHCIRAIGGLNLHTNIKWLISTFTSDQRRPKISKAKLIPNRYTPPVNEPLSRFISTGKKAGVLIRTKWFMESIILPALPKLISQSAHIDDLSLSKHHSIESVGPIMGYPIKVSSNIYSSTYDNFQIIPTNDGIILEVTGNLKLGLNAELSFSIDKQYKLESSIHNGNSIRLVSDGKAIVKGQKNTRWYDCLDFRNGTKVDNLYEIMLETIVNSIDYSVKLLNQHIEQQLNQSLPTTNTKHPEQNSNVLYSLSSRK